MVAKQSLLAHVGCWPRKYRRLKLLGTETCCLCLLYWRSACYCMGFLVLDNWAAGPDQTEVVNVQGYD